MKKYVVTFLRNDDDLNVVGSSFQMPGAAMVKAPVTKI